MDKQLSKEYLISVRERCDKSTSGPWVSFIEGRDHMSGSSVIMRGVNGAEVDLYLTDATIEDYDFIAHARQDIPLLLDEIERLQKLLADLAH